MDGTVFFTLLWLIHRSFLFRGKKYAGKKLREYFKKNKQTVGVNELTKVLKLTEEEKKILSKTLYELEKKES